VDEEQKQRRSSAFRQAHRELLDLIDGLTPQLVPTELKRSAEQTRSLLSKIAGKLTIHLAMEDRALYPRLTSHDNQELRQLAEIFESEMGGFDAAFKSYLQRWPTPEAIQANSVRFVSDTQEMFAALRERISREDVQILSRLDEG
jgi:hypothetical protein